jgi:hypothetical protein
MAYLKVVSRNSYDKAEELQSPPPPPQTSTWDSGAELESSDVTVTEQRKIRFALC